MAIVVPNDSEKFLLDYLRLAAVFNTLHFYQGDETPDANSTVNDFTEADFSGYAPVSLAWAAATTDAGAAKLVSTQIVQTKFGATGNTLYGIYIVYPNGSFGGLGQLIYAERFAVPVDLSVDGSQVIYTPVFTAASVN